MNFARGLHGKIDSCNSTIDRAWVSILSPSTDNIIIIACIDYYIKTFPMKDYRYSHIQTRKITIPKLHEN